MMPLIHLKQTILLFLVALALASFGFSPSATAVSPPPDGGYPGGNTAEGQGALFGLTAGGYNTAVGFFSLRNNTTNNFNTAVGAGALLANTADGNTATGAVALLSNTSGSGNTADGAFALFSNTSGLDNTAIGENALATNTIGFANTAVGNFALHSTTTSSQNTALGTDALENNNTGVGNTAVGFNALVVTAASDYNTAVGINALLNSTGTGNTAVGYQSLLELVNGSYNVALAGGGNLTSGDFNIDIGNDGVNGDSGVIRIGSGCCQSNTFIAGIWGATASGGAAVYINADGQLGTATSSARFKRDIRDMNKLSEALFALRPVSFRYREEIDPQHTPQFGLVAEDVEKANPDLIVRDKQGKPYSVRYDAVNAMLLNEFLKEHRHIREQDATVARLQKQVEMLSAGLQKVSAQVELNRSAPQVANNNK